MQNTKTNALGLVQKPYTQGAVLGFVLAVF